MTRLRSGPQIPEPYWEWLKVRQRLLLQRHPRHAVEREDFYRICLQKKMLFRFLTDVRKQRIEDPLVEARELAREVARDPYRGYLRLGLFIDVLTGVISTDVYAYQWGYKKGELKKEIRSCIANIRQDDHLLKRKYNALRMWATQVYMLFV